MNLKLNTCNRLSCASPGFIYQNAFNSRESGFNLENRPAWTGSSATGILSYIELLNCAVYSLFLATIETMF